MTSGTGARRVLFLTHRFPYPPDRGDRIRSYHLLRALSARYDVDLACVSEEPVPNDARAHVAERVHRLAVERASPLSGKVRAAVAIALGRSFTPAYYYRPGLRRQIHEWHREQPFDALVTFCTGMIAYTRGLRRDAADPLRHILDLVDVDSLKWKSYAASTPPPLRWLYAAEGRRLAAIEAGRHDRIDAVTVVTPAEAAAYAAGVRDGPLLVVAGNGVDADYFHPQPDAGGETLLFTGVLDYRPNVEAVLWFAREVMPILRSRLPQVRFRVVGRNPAPALRDLPSTLGIDVVGPVPDVRPHLHQATAVVAPLRTARGVQNKVLEAMASARACVISPQAARGIDAADGEHVSVAEQPIEWVEQICGLVDDPSRRQRMAEAARRRVEERYVWAKALEPLVDLIEQP